MSPGSSLNRTYLFFVLIAAVVPALLCGYFWLTDLQRFAAYYQLVQPLAAAAGVAVDLSSLLSPQRLALVIAAVLLAVLMPVLFAARCFASRVRRGIRTFADHCDRISRNGGEVDPALLPFIELAPLADGARQAIAEHARSERRLRRSERHSALALDAAGCHLWDLDLAVRRVAADASLFTYLGWGEERSLSIEEMLARIHPDDIARAQAALASPAALHGLELRLQAEDDGYRWFSCRGGVVAADEQGRPLRVLGTASDISARKAIEAELIAARVAAEDASHAKGQFLASVSHELCTPLNGVLGYAQILLRDPAANAEQRHHLIAIESCGRRLLTLINDVLDLARIESGSLELNEDTCDLYHLLQSVADTVRGRADSKLLDFSLEIAPEVPGEAVLDEVRLRQILVNLLNNAVKFTSSGGVVLRVRGGDGGQPLRFQVSDTGIGIAAERHQEIFQPFQQVVAGSAGLGLAISQRLCELMGGHIEVQSAPATGSIFSFALPCRVVTAVPHTAGRHRQNSCCQGARALVADDSPCSRQVLAGLPPARLQAMHAALALGDLEGIRAQLRLLQQGPEPQPAVACHLGQLVDNFEIEALRNLLASTTAQ